MAFCFLFETAKSLRLITAPAGAGKTQHVITQIRLQCESKPLPRILVLLPSGTQRAAFRERLGGLPRPTFGVELSDLSSLYRELLDTAGPLPRVLSEPARRRILRAATRQLAASCHLPYFGPIADKPGFHAAAATWIGDLKENLIAPEELAGYATTPRLRDLATIYWTYQDMLQQHHCEDQAGLGWIARRTLESSPKLYGDFDYAAADGFDTFNRTQVSILKMLGERIPTVDVTLTYEPRRLAHVRFARTLEQFGNATCIQLTARAHARVPALDHLEAHLFEAAAPCVSGQSAISIIQAPERTAEVRAIGREVKRLITNGAPPSQTAVLFHRMDQYEGLVREVFSEFGIPFRLLEGMPLHSNPAIAALLNLFSVSARDYPWRDTLDALRSPYLKHPGVDPTVLSRIAQIAREESVVQGRAQWLNAFKPRESSRNGTESLRLADNLPENELQSLKTVVESFISKTLPERATVREFVASVEQIVGPDSIEEEWQRRHWPERYTEDTSSLRVIECARAGPAELAARDVAALARFKAVLRSLNEASDVLAGDELTRDEFIGELQDAVSAETYDLEGSTDGCVIASDITRARGIPRDFVFVGGLVEGEFPAPVPEDPLLTPAELEGLQEIYVPAVHLQRREQTTVFYEGVSLARQHLYLSHSHYDEDANLLFPSPYLQSVVRLFSDLEPVQQSANYFPSLDEAASPIELAVSATRALARDEEAARSIDRALQRKSATWRHSLFARDIEARRESRAPFDEYSGVLQDPDLRAVCSERFASAYHWSASQFDDWGACGFAFFARRLLRLAEMADPIEGPDARQLGMLYHEVLEKVYRRFASMSIAVSPETLSTALIIMERIGARVLAAGPARLGFRPTAWWEQERGEILRRLKAMLAAEAERNGKLAENGDGLPMPSDFETPFGFRGTAPLRFILPIGPVRIVGQIDRIDRAPEGVVLVDYKLGSTRIEAREVVEGRNLQLPIYVLAAEGMGHRVLDAFFLHVRNGDTSGHYARVDRAGWLDAAKGHIERYVTLARTGAFPVRPMRFENGTCAAPCEFAPLCRVGRWNLVKEME